MIELLEQRQLLAVAAVTDDLTPDQPDDLTQIEVEIAQTNSEEIAAEILEDATAPVTEATTDVFGFVAKMAFNTLANEIKHIPATKLADDATDLQRWGHFALDYVEPLAKVGAFAGGGLLMHKYVGAKYLKGGKTSATGCTVTMTSLSPVILGFLNGLFDLAHNTLGGMAVEKAAPTA